MLLSRVLFDDFLFRVITLGRLGKSLIDLALFLLAEVRFSIFHGTAPRQCSRAAILHDAVFVPMRWCFRSGIVA